MTNEQKTAVLSMRSNGYKYAVIAGKLSISINTVKSYCRRNKADIRTTATRAVCGHCGRPIERKVKSKQRVYCSDKCRAAAWYAKHNKRSKTRYKLVCTNCGFVFESSGNRNRKYCSHECYIADRFGQKRESNV